MRAKLTLRTPASAHQPRLGLLCQTSTFGGMREAGVRARVLYGSYPGPVVTGLDQRKLHDLDRRLNVVLGRVPFAGCAARLLLVHRIPR
jgi:hypothetical protein